MTTLMLNDQLGLSRMEPMGRGSRKMEATVDTSHSGTDNLVAVLHDDLESFCWLSLAEYGTGGSDGVGGG